jgi:hypothetical protein
MTERDRGLSTEDLAGAGGGGDRERRRGEGRTRRMRPEDHREVQDEGERSRTDLDDRGRGPVADDRDREPVRDDRAGGERDQGLVDRDREAARGDRDRGHDDREPTGGGRAGGVDRGPDRAHGEGSRDGTSGGGQPLLHEEDAEELRSRWDEVQVAFVDEPRGAVADADSLVAEVIQQLARRFADERSALEAQWDRGEEVSTDELRLALQRYRSFFNRLLETHA